MYECLSTSFHALVSALRLATDNSFSENEKSEREQQERIVECACESVRDFYAVQFRGGRQLEQLEKRKRGSVREFLNSCYQPFLI